MNGHVANETWGGNSSPRSKINGKNNSKSYNTIIKRLQRTEAPPPHIYMCFLDNGMLKIEVYSQF